MNKLAVILSIWKRPEITALCLERLKEQSKRYNFDVYVAGSEGEDSRSLCEGVNYLEHKNNPVGFKNNALIQQTRGKGYDGVILIGSDNFLSDSIFEYYLECDLTDRVFYSLEDVYFYDVTTKKQGYLKNYTTGVARCFSSPLLEAVDYILWSGINRGLDSNSRQRLLLKGKEIIIKGHLALDVKHCDNINSGDILRMCKSSNINFKDYFCEIWNKVLNLQPKANAMKKSAVRIKYTKDNNQYKKGDIISLPLNLARYVLNSGTAVIYVEEEKPEPIKPKPKPRAKAKECTECKDGKGKPCKGCEDSAVTTNKPTRRKS